MITVRLGLGDEKVFSSHQDYLRWHEREKRKQLETRENEFRRWLSEKQKEERK